MYIEPNTTIYLLNNVPLDGTHEHAIDFKTESDQVNYFVKHLKFDLRNYSYQRAGVAVIRVGINREKLIDCNYMMYKNSAYSNKWFYAFIDSVDYVNDVTANISFTLDPLMNWHFNYRLGECFVVREHTTSDLIGENIVPESVDCGEYVYNGYGKITPFLDKMCVIIVISDASTNPEGTLMDGIYSGATVYAYRSDDVEGIKNKLSSYNTSPDSILSIYMAPEIIAEQAIPNGGLKLIYSAKSLDLNVTADKMTDEMTLDGYKPKNRKLYTYPYNYLTFGTGKSAASYRYEFFENLEPKFVLNLPITMPLQVAMRPLHYKGSGDFPLNSEILILDDYPMCSWNTDAYKAWLAQNAVPIGAAVAAGVGSLAIGAAGMAVPAVVTGLAVNTASSLVSQGYHASIQADPTRGSVNAGNIDVASGNKNFFGGRVSVNRQYAKIIDDYFTRYGYSCKRLKIPNRSVRPHWTYVQTAGATILGELPADDMATIKGIYDKGITWWRSGDEIGNYALDNSVKGE